MALDPKQAGVAKATVRCGMKEVSADWPVSRP